MDVASALSDGGMWGYCRALLLQYGAAVCIQPPTSERSAAINFEAVKGRHFLEDVDLAMELTSRPAKNFKLGI